MGRALLGSSLGLGGLGGSLGGLSGGLLGSLGGLGSGLLLELGGTLGLRGGLGLALSLFGGSGLGGLLLALGLGGSGTLELGLGSTAELVGEALDASAGVNELLLAGVERVALVAQVDRHAGDGRASDPGVAAAAADGALDVVGVDTLLHGRTPLLFAPQLTGLWNSSAWQPGMPWFPTRANKLLNGSMAIIECHEKDGVFGRMRAQLHDAITQATSKGLAGASL